MCFIAPQNTPEILHYGFPCWRSSMVCHDLNDIKENKFFLYFKQISPLSHIYPAHDVLMCLMPLKALQKYYTRASFFWKSSSNVGVPLCHDLNNIKENNFCLYFEQVSPPSHVYPIYLSAQQSPLEQI